MKKLKVFFLDWYDWILPGSSSDNIFLWLLKKNYDVSIDSENPDVLFYSLYFNKHLEYKNCLKIYVNSEPIFYNNLEKYDNNLRHVVSINDADRIITSYNTKLDKNYYMPIFLIWLYHHIFVTKIIPSFEYLTNYREVGPKNNFCSYLHNNPVPIKRKELFSSLNLYKNIHTKNDLKIPDGSLNKILGIKDFKFSFAMQNHYYKDNTDICDVPGLIDEKIIESLIAGTLPLYYGNELVGNYLNEDSFLNYHNFNSDMSFINEVIKLDNNSKYFNDILAQPIVKSLDMLKLNELEQFLIKIIG